MNLNQIQPFSDYWVDCVYNASISILRAVDSSYNKLTYINNYVYKIKSETTPENNQIQFVEIFSNLSPYIDSIFAKDKVIWCGEKEYDIINSIKKAKENNYIFFLGVDLFYWVENSICWNRFHWCHYSLVLDFDDSTDELIVLDDNLQGYYQHRIPLDRAIKASENFRFSNPDSFEGYYLRQIKNVEFKFEIEQIINSSNFLLKSLEDIVNRNRNCWIILDKDKSFILEKILLFSMRCYQFQNRQKGNLRLFDQLYNDGFLNIYELSFLKKISSDLMNNWEELKNKLVKLTISSNPKFNSAEFVNSTTNLFFREKELWSRFISYLNK